MAWLVSLGEWGKWRRAAIPFVQGKRVLELAHGTGHLLGSLSDAGFEVVGIDLSPQMGRIARRQTGGRVSLVRGNGQRLPFHAQSFDSVVVTFPTPFILEQDTLLSLRRVLRDEGCVVIVPSGRLTGSGVIEQLISLAFAVTGQGGDATAYDGWRQAFAQAGFELDVHQVDLGKSAVTILVAQKNDSLPTVHC